MSCRYVYNGNEYSRGEMLKLIKDGKIASAKVVDQSFAKEELRRITGMTDSQIGFVKGLIEDRAIGQLNDDGTILLSDMATTSTVYHEAFHRVWQGALTAQEREAAVNELKTNKNWKQLIEPYRAEYGNNEDVLIEEYFADEFANFVLGEPKPRTFLQKLFDQLVKMLKYITGAKPSEIERIYDMMNKGGYKSRTTTQSFKKSKSITLSYNNEDVTLLYEDFAPVVEMMHRIVIDNALNGGSLSDLLSKDGNKTIDSSVLIDKALAQVVDQLGIQKLLENNYYNDNWDSLNEVEQDKIWFYLAVQEDLTQKDLRKSKIYAKYKQSNELLSKQLKYVQNNEVKEKDEDTTRKKDDDNPDSTPEEGNFTGAYAEKASFEIDPNSRIKTAVRIILSAIENKGDTSRYGMTRNYNWVDLSNFLNENLAGTLATDEAVFDKLEELSRNAIYGEGIKKLIDVLGGKKLDAEQLEIDDLMYNRLQFIVQYTNTTYNMLVTEYDKSKIKIIDASRYSRLQRAAAEMSSLFVESIQNYGGVENFFKAMISLDKQKAGEKKFLDLYNLNYYYDLLNKEQKEEMYSELQKITTVLIKSINSEKETRLPKLVDAFSNATFSTFNLETAGKKIAELILSTGMVTESSMITAAGERVYGIALNNYMTQTVNEINHTVEQLHKEKVKAVDMLPEFLNRMPHLKSWGGTNSFWLKKILATNGRIRINVNQGVKTEDGSIATEMSEVEETSLFSVYISQLLNPKVTHYQTVKHSDRSVLYSVQVDIPTEQNKTYLAITDVKDAPFEQSFKDVFANYLYEEAISLANLPKDVQYLSSVKNEDTFFGQFVDYNKLLKKDSAGNLTPVLKNSPVFAIELDKLYKGFVEHSRKEHAYISESGVYEKVGQGTRAVPVGIDLSVWNHYKSKVADALKVSPKDKNEADRLYDRTVEVISRLYSVNSLVGNIEQSFILTGDPKLYKNGPDSFKRFSVWSSTGELSAHGETVSNFIIQTENREENKIYIPPTGKSKKGKYISYNSIENAKNPDVIATAAFAEEDYYVPERQLNNYKKRSKNSMYKMLINLGMSTEDANSFSEKHAEKLKSAYGKTNWGDGQSYINLFQWRRTKIQWGQWSEAHQRLFEMEVRIFNGDYSAYTVPEGDAYVYFNEFLGLAETMKGQYAGPYWTNQTKNGYSAQGVAKTSFYPLLPSQIMGTKLESIHRNLVLNGVGIKGFGSARKVGQRIKTVKNNITGRYNPVDDSKALGNRNLVKGMKMAYSVKNKKAVANDNVAEDLNSHIQFMETKYFKHQVAIANKEKGKVISSTQSYKLTISNLFNEGIPIDVKYSDRQRWSSLNEAQRKEISEAYRKVSKYTDIMAKRIAESISFLEEQTGFDRETKEYSDIKKLVDELKRSLNDRGAASNVLDVMDLFAKAEHKAIELLPNRFKIEPVMYSLVRNEVTNQKRNGNAVPQVSSIFFEKNDTKTPTVYKEVKNSKGETEGRIYVAEDYQMYEDNKSYADIGMPFPTKWLNDFMKLYGTRDVIKLIEMVNKDIEENNFEKFDEKMLFLKGLRIPNQQLSSNDVFRVKRFFVPTNTAMVVVPPIIATKVGSDFDIDKLNMYLGHGMLSGRGKNMKFSYVTNEIIERSLSESTDEFLSFMGDTEFLQSGLSGIEKAKQVIEKYAEQIDNLGEDEREDLEKRVPFQKLRSDLMDLESKRSLFRKAEENELLETELDIMTLEVNFMNLMKPTDDTHWRIEAKSKLAEISKYGKLNANTKEDEAFYESLDPNKKLTIFDAYTAVTNVIKTRENIASKGGVGQVAVSITNNTVNQLYGYQIQLTVVDNEGNLIANRTLPFLPADKNSSFSAILNQENEFISELLSGLLTSQVDAVKDPYAKVLGLVGDTLNMATYLLQRGVPHMDILYFFAQPIIREYIKQKAIYESVPYRVHGLDRKEKFRLSQKYDSKESLPFLKALDKFENQLVKEQKGKGKRFTYRYPDFPGIDNQKVFLKTLREFNPKAQPYMLSLFSQISRQTSEHRTFMSAVSLDTFKPIRREEWIERAMKIEKALKNKLVVDLENLIESQNAMRTYFDVYRQYDDMYKKFYFTEEIDLIGNMNLKKTVDKYIDKEKIDRFRKVVSEDFITYLVQNNKDFFERPGLGKSILFGGGGKRSFAKVIQNLKKHGDDKNFRVLKTMIPLLNANTFNGNPIDAIRRSSLGENLFMLNEYIEEIKDIAFENPELFSKMLSYSIYSSGFSNNILSLDSILPVKDDIFESNDDPNKKLYTKFSLAQEQITWFNNLDPVLKQRVLLDFRRRFFAANPWLLKKRLVSDEYEDLGEEAEIQLSEALENSEGLPVYFSIFNRETKKLDVVEYFLTPSGTVETRMEALSGFGYKIYNAPIEKQGIQIKNMQMYIMKRDIKATVERTSGSFKETTVREEATSTTEPSATTTTPKKGFTLTARSEAVKDYVKKDQGKANLANRFIGYGVKGSSTLQYEQDARRQGIPVNYDGEVDENTIAFVSVSGGSKVTEEAIEETYENARYVLEAGGTVIMDSTTDANRPYNKSGEGAVQEELGTPSGQTSKGYNYWGPNPELPRTAAEPTAPSQPTAKTAQGGVSLQRVSPEVYEKDLYENYKIGATIINSLETVPYYGDVLKDTKTILAKIVKSETDLFTEWKDRIYKEDAMNEEEAGGESGKSKEEIKKRKEGIRKRLYKVYDAIERETRSIYGQYMKESKKSNVVPSEENYLDWAKGPGKNTVKLAKGKVESSKTC